MYTYVCKRMCMHVHDLVAYTCTRVERVAREDRVCVHVRANTGLRIVAVFFAYRELLGRIERRLTDLFVYYYQLYRALLLVDRIGM